MSKQRVYAKSSDFKPRHKCVLVNPIELKSEEKTDSGLIVGVNENKSVLTRPTMGEVISFGHGITDLEIGDTVFWGNTDGIDYEFDDGVKVLLRDESVLGVKA